MIVAAVGISMCVLCLAVSIWILELWEVTSLCSHVRHHRFRYAVNSVRCLIHRRRLVWSWSYIKQVRYVQYTVYPLSVQQCALVLCTVCACCMCKRYCTSLFWTPLRHFGTGPKCPH